MWYVISDGIYVVCKLIDVFLLLQSFASSQHCLSSNNESLWCCCSWFKLVSSSFVLRFDLVLSEWIIGENKLSVATLFAGRNLRKAVEFGKTHVVRPKGKHQATIVWLHGLGDNGSRYLFLNGGYILNSNVFQ